MSNASWNRFARILTRQCVPAKKVRFLRFGTSSEGMTIVSRLVVRFLLAILIIDQKFWTRSVLASSRTTTFCQRAVASKSCANPPTFDSVNIEAYFGRWYEIGSSANFKLTRERGSVCDQATYGNASRKVSVLNSSLKVIGYAGMASLVDLTSAATGVCNGARDICYDLGSSSSISQLWGASPKAWNFSTSDKTESALLAKRLQNILKSIKLTESALESLAKSINHIQEQNGQISQANASLTGSIAAIKEYSSRASKQLSVINVLVGDIYRVRQQMLAVIKKVRKNEANVKYKLEQSATVLGETARKLAGSSSAIAESLEEMQAGAMMLLENGQPLAEKEFVSYVVGTASQNSRSAGKLEVNINGKRGPYWILRLEEDDPGYTAALIYSCTELQPARLDRTIFILSREPQLDKIIVDRFLELAKSYGVYNDCENPFLFSLQRGGNCGRPPRSR